MNIRRNASNTEIQVSIRDDISKPPVKIINCNETLYFIVSFLGWELVLTLSVPTNEYQINSYSSSSGFYNSWDEFDIT